MILDVPVVRQKKDSVDCGLAGLSMILKYYGVDKSIEDLKKEIKTFDFGTYMPQLGLYLLNNGFDVEIVTLNPLLFTKNFESKSDKEILEYFEFIYEKNKDNKFGRPLKFFLDFLKAGGKIVVKIPSFEDVKNEILEKRPLGVLLTSNFLLYDKAIFNVHFNIITGFDENYVYVNDPMWDFRGGKKKYFINDFFYGVYASAYGDLDNASIMKVKKK